MVACLKFKTTSGPPNLHEQKVGYQYSRAPKEYIFPTSLQRWLQRLRTRKNLPDGSARGRFKDETSHWAAEPRTLIAAR